MPEEEKKNMLGDAEYPANFSDSDEGKSSEFGPELNGQEFDESSVERSPLAQGAETRDVSTPEGLEQISSADLIANQEPIVRSGPDEQLVIVPEGVDVAEPMGVPGESRDKDAAAVVLENLLDHSVNLGELGDLQEEVLELSQK